MSTALSRPPHAVAPLSLDSLAAVKHQVRRPGFDPAALRPGILHLGCGAFHRAHQALLTQRAIEVEHAAGRHPLPPWGIVSTSLRTPAVAQHLAAQDGLFTVLERDAEHTCATVVGSLRNCIFASARPAALRAVFLDPAIRIVTMTVTAAGYCADGRSGHLDTTDPQVQADLRQPHPSTAIGVLVGGLRQRRDAGLPPPVILSCDNLPGNGRLLRQMCIDFAALQDDALSRWIGECVAFPSTMVDRIVPVCTRTDLDDARAALGLVDAVPVSTEPYAQWVIEHFDGSRPRWDAVGAEYVHDVGPWEASKLRLLNGGHLAIACLGRLAGCRTVADALAVPGVSTYVLHFMLDEQKPTLPPSEHDIDAYARQLLARWRSRGIVHQLDRLLVQGSAKLPARLLDSLRENRRARRPTPCTLLAVAAWMLCTLQHDEAGMPFVLDDAMQDTLARRAGAHAHDPERLVDALLALPEIFGDLYGDPEVRAGLQQAALLLRTRGARGAIATCVAGARRPIESA